MDQRWVKGHKDKGERQKTVLSYRNAFDDLREILLQLEEKNRKEDYESPSWAYKQADQNGANRMLRQVLSIINLESKSK